MLSSREDRSSSRRSVEIMANTEIQPKYERLGRHSGMWLQEHEIVEHCFIIEEASVRPLAYWELYEGQIICFRSDFYELFLEDINRDRYFLIPCT